MRGQIVWMAQPKDEQTGRPARAVAVEYDAEEVFVREAEDGVLTVSNANLVFGGKGIGGIAARRDSVGAELLAAIEAYTDRSPRLITTTARPNTLHSVEVDFAQRQLYVAHGRTPAQSGEYVAYALP